MDLLWLDLIGRAICSGRGTYCEGCWAKFAEFDGPRIQHEGYVAKGRLGEERWVCRECFEDLKDDLGWTLEWWPRRNPRERPTGGRSRWVGSNHPRSGFVNVGLTDMSTCG
jgi:hypothetical protein